MELFRGFLAAGETGPPDIGQDEEHLEDHLNHTHFASVAGGILPAEKEPALL